MLFSGQQKLSSASFGLFLSVLLLISCNANANTDINKLAKTSNVSRSFSNIVKEVKQLKGSNANAALAKLNTANTYLGKLSLVEQLTFYKFKADLYAELSRFQLAKKISNQGLVLAKALQTPSILVTELLYTRGFAFESLGDLSQASKNYLNGLDVAQSLNNQQFIAQGLINMGAVYYQSDRYKLSLTVLNDALKIAEALDDEDLKGYINTELGILYAYIGENEQSLKFYRIAYQHYSNIGKTAYAVNALTNIAMNHQDNDRYEEAIEAYKELIPSAEKIDNSQVFYNIYMGLSWSYLRKEKSDPETAYQYLLIAEQYLPDIERHLAPLNFLIDKSFILEDLQRYDDALESLYQAEKLIPNKDKSANDLNYLSILGLKAKIYRALGYYQTAYQILSDYVDRYLNFFRHQRMAAVQDVRLRYESEQSELQKKRLKKQASKQALDLLKVETSNENQKTYFLFIALVVVIFSWLLYRLGIGQRRLLYSSRIDNLTGLVNRRRFIQLGERLLNSAKQQANVSLLMIDVDYFKKINDEFGHKQGDIVLQTLAELASEVLRKADVFARFGGEEFVVLLPNTNNEQAINTAERLRKAIENATWQIKSSVTVSIGVASFGATLDASLKPSLTLNQLIKIADDFLYQAKAQGRNQVCAK
jgi:diguanylate cyclase (GGDEF)-like protein